MAAETNLKRTLEKLQPTDRRRVRNSVSFLLQLGLGNERPSDMAALLGIGEARPVRAQSASAFVNHSNGQSDRSKRVTETINVTQVTHTKDAADMLLNTCLEITSELSRNMSDVVEALITGAATLLQADRCSFFSH